MGAERICKQLGYQKGVRGPRKTNPGGSGPVHALSHVPHVLSRCPHTIDQSVICSGGLGPGHGMETKEIRGEMEKRKAKEKLVQKPVQLTSAARGCRKCVDQCHSRKLQRCRIFKCDTSRAMCEVYCQQEKECTGQVPHSDYLGIQIATTPAPKTAPAPAPAPAPEPVENEDEDQGSEEESTDEDPFDHLFDDQVEYQEEFTDEDLLDLLVGDYSL